LIGETTTSIKTLLQTRTYEELQAQARAVTPTSDLFMIGLSRPVSPKWQIGGDVRKSRFSGTAGSATVPPTAASGNVMTYSMQLTGIGLFAKRDISVMSLSYIDALTYSGNSVSLANRALLGEKWSFDTALRWYGQNDTSTNTKITRISPSLRTGYKWKEKVTLEGEIGAEKSTTHNPTTHDDTSRNYWSLGYRWDF
jgi:hypothetical protein